MYSPRKARWVRTKNLVAKKGKNATKGDKIASPKSQKWKVYDKMEATVWPLNKLQGSNKNVSIEATNFDDDFAL